MEKIRIRDPGKTSRNRNTATMYDTYGLSKLRGGQGFFLLHCKDDISGLVSL